MKNKVDVEAFVFKPVSTENTRITKIERQDKILELEYPVFGKEEVDDIVSKLAVRKRKAHNRPLDETIDILERVGDLWRDKNYDLRKEALDVLPMITGQSRRLCEAELDATLNLWARPAIELYMDQDLGDKRYMEEWIYNPDLHIKVHAQPRGLILHNLAGNAFSVGMGSLFYGLITKNVNLVKLAREDPFFTSLFAMSVGEVDRKLGNELAVLYWPGSKTKIFDSIFKSGHLDSILAWGGLMSIESLRRRAYQYGIKIISHGPKLSFSIISDEVLDSQKTMEDLAEKIALDASFWNQRACFSPRVIYIKEKPRNSAIGANGLNGNSDSDEWSSLETMLRKEAISNSKRERANPNSASGRDLGALMQRSAAMLKNNVTDASPLGFAKILAEKMKKVSNLFPRANQTEADGIAMTKKREYFSMNYEMNDKGIMITPRTDNKLDWTVLYLRNPPTLNEIDMFQDRFICVTRISNILDLVHFMREEGLQKYLQTISIDGTEEFIEETAHELSLLGAARFPRIGDHNKIVLGAPWDGHYILTELVRWTYYEPKMSGRQNDSQSLKFK